MNTTTTLTGIKKLAVYSALLGSLGAAALGVGSGLAQAATTLGSTSAVHIAAQAARQDGDQEVVRRGTVIPVHGDDDHPAAASHISAPAHTDH